VIEEYTGIKFKPVCEKKELLRNPSIKELISWGKHISDEGMAPTYITPLGSGSGGNLSFRTDRGMITTASYSHLGHLHEMDFTEVLSCDIEKKEVHFIGLRNPSSEAILHWLVYQGRPEVNAVFHFHDDAILKSAQRLDLAVTKKFYPYGSLELAKETMNALGDSWFLVLRDHGCLSLGRTIDDAGERALEVHGKAIGDV